MMVSWKIYLASSPDRRDDFQNWHGYYTLQRHLMWQSTWKSCVSSDNSAPKPALGLSMVFTEQLEVVTKLSDMSSFLLICSRQIAKLPLWCLPLKAITWPPLRACPHSRLSPSNCLKLVYSLSTAAQISSLAPLSMLHLLITALYFGWQI